MRITSWGAGAHSLPSDRRRYLIGLLLVAVGGAALVRTSMPFDQQHHSGSHVRTSPLAPTLRIDVATDLVMHDGTAHIPAVLIDEGSEGFWATFR
jgi:hypothetical protein